MSHVPSDPLGELSPQDREAVEALRILGELTCTHCGRPLNRRRKEFTCPACYQVHCPFCERSVDARCSHYIAYLTRGWHFPGVIAAGWQVPFLEVAPPQLLEWSAEQLRAAFGSALPLLTDFRNRINVDSLRASGELFSRLLPHAAECSHYHGGIKHPGIHYFARDPDAARADAQKMLHDLQTGWARLAKCVPLAQRYVERIICLSDAGDDVQAGSEGGLCFAPGTGRRLARGFANAVCVWDIDSDAPPRRFRLPDGAQVESFAFSPDGAQIEVRTGLEGQDDDTPATAYTWDFTSGALLATRQIWYSPDFNSIAGEYDFGEEEPSCSFQGLMHGGETQLDASGCSVVLSPLTPLCPGDEVRFPDRTTSFSIGMRDYIHRVAIAPDGDHFATALGEYLIVWRITYEEMGSATALLGPHPALERAPDA